MTDEILVVEYTDLLSILSIVAYNGVATCDLRIILRFYIL